MAYSAGCSPSYNQQPNPLSLQVLKNSGISIDGLRSKLWDVFGRMDAPKMDFVITVCETAAGEVGPFWPGQPVTAHWGFLGTCAGAGTDSEAFRPTMIALKRRLEILVSLPLIKLEKTKLQGSARDLADAH